MYIPSRLGAGSQAADAGSSDSGNVTKLQATVELFRRGS